ncbi:MAG: GNAT family N-acetyltransferase [Promethearchaeota archaeon]|nr:MAG: GNAT family N-acetyltransferase [Candidatus Lokiarchaeota archaeon]
MKIKKVTPKDITEINNLEHQVFKEDAFSKDIFEKLIHQNNMFYKLEKKGIKKILVGFVTVVKDRKDRVNIINFVINPKYQNKGYGSLLLKYTIERIKKTEEDIKKIILNVKTNNSIAIKLYEKFNFRKIKRIEYYYKSKQSAYLMEKEIEENNN